LTPSAGCGHALGERCTGSPLAMAAATKCERALNTPHLWASNFPQF
jgi:hypothetical protein